MRYNAKSLEIKVVISGNVLLFKDIKISLGLLNTAREIHPLFRKNRFLKVSTTANNRITVSAVDPKIRPFLIMLVKLAFNATRNSRIKPKKC